MTFLANFSTITLFACAFILYSIGLVLYRLFLSPISKFPGSKLTASTLWYELYYEAIKQGQFTFKIQEWHKKYGPIIRINPYELHIDDAEFYGVVFSNSGIRDKHAFYTAQFGNPNTAFGAVHHDLHRMRRQALNPFFSKAAVVQLTPVISSLVERLCSRIDEVRGTGQPLNMRLAYMCLTTDVVTRYGLNRSWDLLDSPDFSPVWKEMIRNTAAMTKWTKQFPWLFAVFKNLPDGLVKMLNPDIMLVLDMQKKINIQILEIMESKEPNPALSESEQLPRTIFHALWNNPNLPPEEKSIDHLGQTGQDVIGAGGESTGAMLTITTFYLLNTPRALKRLKAELEEAMKDKYGQWELSVAESLPYLTGVVNEGLRLFYGVSSRLSRIAPNEVLKFQDWDIPAGTPIGMSSILLHHNESIFPSSHSFLPERWADDPDRGRSLERYLVTFSKGSRQCVGINLAKAEISLTLATLFRRYEMELFDTTFERDVQVKHDMFLPQPSNESKGVRVVFT